MTKGLNCMKIVDPITWKHGYLFIDDTALPGQRQIRVRRCEANISCDQDARVTLFFHVCNIDRVNQIYDIYLFSNESAKTLLAQIEVHFANLGMTNAEYIISIFDNNGLEQVAERVACLLHQLVFPFIIQGRVPIDRKTNRAAIEWYVGFNERFFTSLRDSLKSDLRDTVFHLRSLL